MPSPLGFVDDQMEPRIEKFENDPLAGNVVATQQSGYLRYKYRSLIWLWAVRQHSSSVVKHSRHFCTPCPEKKTTLTQPLVQHQKEQQEFGCVLLNSSG